MSVNDRKRRKRYWYGPGKSVRTSFAASTLAGLSKFGVSEERREMTLNNCVWEIVRYAKQWSVCEATYD
jgi:hypothetical protein